MTDVLAAGGHARHLAARAPRTRLDPFPRRTWLRWLFRAGFALPYVGIAILGAMSEASSLGTPNAQLLAKVAAIDWTQGDITWADRVYPPISTLVAAIVPGGGLGLSVMGALVAGVFLQKVLEIMVQRRFPAPTVVLLMFALAANPLFAYTATQNFAATLGIACFGLALADLVRFVAWGNTRSGFRAGIFLMLAALSDLGGIIYVVTAAVATPFLRLGRAGQTGARWANVLVILFPTVAALISVLVLNWVFTGDPIGAMGEAMESGTPQRWASLWTLFTGVQGWLLVAPVLGAWAVALIVRQPGSIFVSTLVFAALMGAYVLGLTASGSAGNTFIVMVLMAIALIPTARERVTVVLVDVVALLQIGIAWTTGLTRPAVVAWLQLLGMPL